MSSFLARRATTAAPQYARAFSSTPARPFAKIIIVGTLGNTPEITTTNSGREVMKYSIASSQRVRGEPVTSWFRVANFSVDGARRDFYQALPKGTMVYVEGEASINTFTDRDGNSKTSLNIVQRSLEVLRRPAHKEEGEGEESASEE